MHRVQVVKLGDFAVPSLQSALSHLSRDGYAEFHVDEGHIQLPEPDYIIPGVVQEYSFDLLLSLIQLHRATHDIHQETVIVGLVNRSIEKNYFSCTYSRHACAVISCCDVEALIAPFSLVQFIARELARHTVALFEGHQWHREPRKCPFDFCGDKRDIVISLGSSTLCDACRITLSTPAATLLKSAASFDPAESQARRANVTSLEPTPDHKVKIMFLAANPLSTSRLDLEEEQRGVENELRAVKFRERVELVSHYAVRPDDLLRHVRSDQPKIVHFSGHGSPSGIMLRNDSGKHQSVSGASLARFFEGRGVELVVLNACFTGAQAADIGRSVRAVIGTSSAVGDEAARRFSCAFYRTLGDGFSIEDAFRDGGDAVALHGLSDVFQRVGELNWKPFNS